MVKKQLDTGERGGRYGQGGGGQRGGGAATGEHRGGGGGGKREDINSDNSDRSVNYAYHPIIDFFTTYTD